MLLWLLWKPIPFYTLLIQRNLRGEPMVPSYVDSIFCTMQIRRQHKTHFVWQPQRGLRDLFYSTHQQSHLALHMSLPCL